MIQQERDRHYRKINTILSNIQRQFYMRQIQNAPMKFFFNFLHLSNVACWCTYISLKAVKRMSAKQCKRCSVEILHYITGLWANPHHIGTFEEPSYRIRWHEWIVGIIENISWIIWNSRKEYILEISIRHHVTLWVVVAQDHYKAHCETNK